MSRVSGGGGPLAVAFVDIRFRGIAAVRAGLSKIKSLVTRNITAINAVSAQLFSSRNLLFGGAGFALTIKAAAGFEDAIVSLGANMRLLGEDGSAQLDKLRKTAQRMGTTTVFMASQAAEAMNELALGGLNTEEVIATIGPTLDLASAAGLGLAEAAKIMSDNLNVFNLSAGKAAQIGDLLVSAQTKAQTTARELAGAIGGAAGVSAAFGLSLRELTQLLTGLAKTGTRGAEAGTALSIAIARLADPPADAAAALKELNVDMSTFIDSEGKFTDVIGAFEALAAASIKPVQALKIFGARGRKIVGLLELIKRTSSETGNFVRDLGPAFEDDAGRAALIAAARVNTFKGQLKILLSTVEAAAIAFGTKLTGALLGTVKVLQDVFTFIAKLPPALLDNIAKAAVWTVMLLGAAVAVKQLIKVAAFLRLTLLAVTGPIGLLIAGIGIFATAIKAARSDLVLGPKINAAFKELVETFNFLIGGTSQLGATLKDTLVGIWQIVQRAAVGALERISDFLRENREFILSLVKTIPKVLGFIAAVFLGVKVFGLISAAFLVFKTLLLAGLVVGQAAWAVFWAIATAPALLLIAKFVLIGAVIAVVAAAVIGLGFLLFKLGKQVVKSIGEAFGLAKDIAVSSFDAIASAVEPVTSFIGRLFSRIGTVVSAVFGAISSVVSTVFGVISGVVKFFFGFIVFIAKAAIGIMVGLFKLLGSAIKFLFLATIPDIVKTTFSLAVGIVKAFFSTVVGVFNDIVAGIKGVFVSIGDAVSEWFQLIGRGVMSVIDLFGQVFSELSKGFVGIGGTIKSTFGGIVDAIKAGEIGLAFKILVGGLKVVWLQFMDTLADAWGKFQIFFVDAWVGTVLIIKQTWFKASQVIGDAFLSFIQGIVQSQVSAIKLLAKALPVGGGALAEAAEAAGGAVTGRIAQAREILQEETARNLAQAGNDAADAVRGIRATIEDENTVREASILAMKKEQQARLTVAKNLAAGIPEAADFQLFPGLAVAAAAAGQKAADKAPAKAPPKPSAVKAPKFAGLTELSRSIQEAIQPTKKDQQDKKQAKDIEAIAKASEQIVDPIKQIADKIGGPAVFA